MTEIPGDRQGYYVKWTWNELRKCWEYFTPHCIYPVGGKFVVSTHEVWHDRNFDNFDDAEAEALMSATE